MTLSQTAVLTKQVIVVSTITLVLGLASFIGYKIWYAYYLAHLPPVEEKPDTRFGLLPLPDLPRGVVSSSNFSYSVDTSTGNLPKVGVDTGFEKLSKVYFISKIFAGLLSAEKSQGLADKLEIKSQPEILSETNYRFKDSGKTLTIDLNNGNFVYTNEATISAQEGLDDDTKLIADFKSILSKLGVLKEDLNNGRNKVIPLKNFIPAEIRSEANSAQISLWPAAIDKRLILTAEFNTSPINALVYKNADDLKNYFSINFTYYPIDTSTFATYPIKTTDEAFLDLRSGRGSVIIEPIKPQVSITSIYLAYFLSENYSPYLQPVFVFEGPHFVSYVPAISNDFLSTNEQSQPK